MPRVPEPFYKPIKRESFAIISADEKIGHICLDNASRRNFQGTKVDVVYCTYIGITIAEGANVALYSGDQ
jgi:hypothetical protein